MTKKLGGIELLRQQAYAHVDEEFEALSERPVGDSEIERLFFAALHICMMFDPTREPFTLNGGTLVFDTEEKRQRYLTADPAWWVKDALVIAPQVQIGQWRVDFVIYAFARGPDAFFVSSLQPVETARWRRLVVECDGHDFHEKTKAQAARDKARDRDLVMAGYEVFRFTGSELWRDPWGCAEQVRTWAESGI